MKKISPSDWIQMEGGHLFGAPFLANCLLYRLYDVNVSVLLHHSCYIRQTISSNSDYDSTSNYIVDKSQTYSLKLYTLPSAKAALPEMVEAPQRQYALKTIIRFEDDFDNFKLSLTKHDLDISRQTHPCTIKDTETTRTSIAGTQYYISGGMLYKSFLDGAFSWIPSNFLPKWARTHCWKVSLIKRDSQQAYDLNVDKSWSLTALRIAEKWHIERQLCLELRSTMMK